MLDEIPITFILIMYFVPMILDMILAYIVERLDGKGNEEIIKEEIFGGDGYLLLFIIPAFNIYGFGLIFSIIKKLYKRNKKEKVKKSYERLYKDLRSSLIYTNTLTEQEIDDMIDSASVMKKLIGKVK